MKRESIGIRTYMIVKYLKTHLSLFTNNQPFYLFYYFNRLTHIPSLWNVLFLHIALSF